MTIAEIAEDIHVPISATIVAELLESGLWISEAIDGRTRYAVAKFEEMTTPADPRAAERVKRYRERNKSRNVTACNAVTDRNSNAVTERNCNGSNIDIQDQIAKPIGLAQPRQEKLPDTVELRKRDILALMWTLVAPALSGLKTATKWKAENAAAARDIATATLDQDFDRVAKMVTLAHKLASERLGGTVRRLDIVQDELIKQREHYRALRGQKRGDAGGLRPVGSPS